MTEVRSRHGRSLLLDTNVVSELRRLGGPRADPRFVEWARSAPADQAISAITLFELELGVGRIEMRDPRQGAGLRSWLDTVRTAFGGRVLPVDEAVAATAARWHVPDPASDRDAFIGATAAVHGLVVVTRNVGDFARFGVPLLNPWGD